MGLEYTSLKECVRDIEEEICCLQVEVKIHQKNKNTANRHITALNKRIKELQTRVRAFEHEFVKKEGNVEPVEIIKRKNINDKMALWLDRL